MIIQEPVQAAIWHCLNHYDTKDAVFLAERLCSEVETDETIFILATSYFRSNMIHQAYWLLKEKSRRSPECRFLLAKCAFHLKKYSEAECALSSVYLGELKNFDEIAKDFGEIACFVLQLIAQICVKTERDSIAADAYRKALKLNPFLWTAFAELCNLGADVDPKEIFQVTSTDIFNTSQGNTNTNSMVLFGSGDGFPGSLDGTQTLSGNNGSILHQQQTTIGGDLVNSLNNSSNYILTTPVDQSNTVNLMTPNNNNLNSSMTILRGGNIGLGGAPAPISNSLNTTIEDTPVVYGNNNNSSNLSGSGGGIAYMETSNFDGGTPFRRQFKYLSAMSPSTPSFGILPISPGDTPYLNLNTTLHTPSPQTLVEANQEQKAVGKKLKTHVGSLINRKETTSKPAVFTQTGNITPRTPNTCTTGTGLGAQNVRRSSRLFSNSNYSVKENNKSPNISKFVQPRSPPRKTKQRIPKISLNSNIEINEKDKKEKIETITSNDSKVLLNNSLNSAQTMAHHVLNLKRQSAEGLMALLRDLGQGYYHLTRYNCQEAIKSFETIPKHHLSSSWVQSQIGRSHYELREYENSVTLFRKIHENDPHRLDSMEIYSSSLWHLQKEVDLSALAQDLMAQDKNSPITWCVSGNCFSLHKEHETAIKFFKRAVQVDPDFVYSYTLLGHELVLTEELDKALNFFRTAVLKDPRHYNAWFGIGTIYSKQEKYELAELHYDRALKINPKNSVILVHIGAMQYFMQKKEQSLQTLNRAAAIDPKNPLARFHRGSIYFSLGKHQEALRELEELKEIVPKESVVFYLIGKIHKALGNVDSALMHFSWATDLDPKGANNQLKDAFDSMSHPSCCPPMNDLSLDPDLEPISERSDDSTQAQQDVNYDSDSY